MKNILVVGTGSIGRRHIDNFSKYCQNIDIVDVRADRIKEANQKFYIRNSYKYFKTALENNNYDAVIITTPPNFHLPIAKMSVEKGCNILIEKPLGMNSKGWKRVADLCKSKKLINYVAYCHRHINYTQKVKKYIDKGFLGKILNANVRWGSYFPDWHPWERYTDFYMAKKEQGGGALLDESHGIDLIRYFFGEASEVFAMIDKISNLKINTDDNAFLTLKMKNQMLVQLSFDLISRSTFCRIEMNGSKGSIIWDRVDHSLKYYSSKTKKWKKEKFTKKDFLDMYPNQAKHFVSCLRKKTKPAITIYDALKTQKIIDCSFLSNKKKKNN